MGGREGGRIKSTGGSGALGGTAGASRHREGRVSPLTGGIEGEKARSGSAEVSIGGATSGRGTGAGVGVADPADPSSAPSRKTRGGGDREVPAGKKRGRGLRLRFSPALGE